MQNYKLILASQSPRRKELLSQLNRPFEVVVRDSGEEVYPDGMANEAVPVYLAKQKAEAYKADYQEKDVVVITADTIVCCNGEVLGKPKDKEDAVRMLKMLSNCGHKVITGVTLTSAEKQKSFTASTTVFFKELTEDEIEYYIENYQPFDKAGAYGIQEWIGMIGIERIEGSYFNVVGLPVQKLYTELLKF
ncbi:MAG: Maf-like protein [Carboxylicivirga sp.]|jgi:septum formation protein|nr:Maf-like protein [Carboxylicivirga sp.]